MKIKQLSVFLENRPGHLSNACKTLAAAGISIETLMLADTAEFGILRLIVRDWAKGRKELEKAGYTVNVTDMLAIEAPARPGGLEKILQIAEDANLGVDYMYAFTLKKNEKALLVIRFSDQDQALAALASAGIVVLSSVDLFA